MAPKKIEFGDLLVKEGCITQEMLDEMALEVDEAKGLTLERLLVEKGVITEDWLAREQSIWLGVEYYDLDRIEPDPNILSIIKPEVAQRYCCFPVGYYYEAGDCRLTVATADPMDQSAQAILQGLTNLPVHFVLGTKNAILRKIEEYYFPEKAREKNKAEDSSGFVLLSDYVPGIVQEIRYHSTYNFVGERVDGYEAPVALLTKEAARAIREISNRANVMGYRLKIFDAYRPACAVRHFVLWGIEDLDQRMKPFFYPDLEKQELFEKGYIAKQSSHSRGSTVDLTLLDMQTGKELDMGSPFDYFGEISHPDYADLTEEQAGNRRILRDLMVQNGFVPIDCEWWHYTLADEPYPDTYFEFPVTLL